MRRVVVWILVLSVWMSVGQMVGAVSVSCTAAPSVASGYAACIQVVHGGRTLTYRMNAKVYRERGIVVYGGPIVLGEMGNTFVARTKPNPNGTQTVAGGYYVRDGVHGEYRYHGYDAAGNKYENAWFPDDVVVNPPEERTWIYRPWTNPNQVMTGVRNAPTTPGLYATAGEVANRTIVAGAQVAYSKLARGLGWFPQTRYPSGATSGTTIADYAYVHQKATTRVSGAASLWSVGRKSGKAWVQTFAIPKLVAGDKRMVPVTVSMQVKSRDREVQPFDFSKSSEVGVKVLDVEVIATLGDAAYDADEKLRDLYLTRRDMLFGTAAWKIQLFNDLNQSLGTIQIANQGYRNPTTGLVEARGIGRFKLRVTPSQLSNLVYPLKAVATANFVTGEASAGTGTASPGFQIQSPVPPDSTIGTSISPNVPSTGFDIVKFAASDATNMTNVMQRTLKIDGIVINGNSFFSGDYTFGVGKHGQHLIEISYLFSNWTTVLYRKSVTIYDTKPFACLAVSGELKEGRTVSIRSCSSTDNLPQVINTYPIQSYKFELDTIDGNLSTVTPVTSTNTQKQLRFQQAGTYVVRLQVTNSLGRASDEVEVAFEIQPDFAPALIQHAFDSQVVRGSPVTFFSESSSIDGDTMLPTVHTVFWDKDGDGVAEHQVVQFTGTFTSYLPAELGDYEVQSVAQETLGKQIQSTTYFKVQNEAPTTDLFIDQPEQRTKVDLFVMLDASLPRSEVQAFSQQLVSLQNALSASKVDAQVKKWDGYPYVYQQPLSTHVSTVQGPLASSMTYTAGGYTGRLSLTNSTTTVVREDHGSNQTVTDRRVETDQCENVVHYYYDLVGNQIGHSSYSVCPQSINYNDGVFTGVLSRTGESTTDPACPYHKSNNLDCTQRVIAQYEGEVTHVYTKWVSNWVDVTHYDGTYAGSGYREVTEPIPFLSPFSRVDATPHIVYITTNRVNQSEAITQMDDLTNATITIFAGNNPNWTERSSSYIETGQTDSTWRASIEQWLATSTVKEEAVALVDEPITINRSDDDQEHDLIIDQKEMLIHDETTIDDAEGLEVGASASLSAASWQRTFSKTSFHKPGTYTIRRQVRDQPVSACLSCDFSERSNIAEQSIFVHRKPVADIQVHSSWDEQGGAYMIQPLDASYDPDNRYRRTDKGILHRRVQIIKSGEQQIAYAWPTRLNAGVYTIEYAVQDVNEVWSVPLTMTLTLLPNGGVDVQLDAEVRRTADWQAFHTKKQADEPGPLAIYAGEKLVVMATLGSGTAQASAETNWVTKRGDIVHTQIELLDSGDGVHFQANLHDMDWMDIQDPIEKGIVHVLIRATNKNGTSKEVDVPLHIVGSIYETYGVQRIK